jgi:hypothetical protein
VQDLPFREMPLEDLMEAFGIKRVAVFFLCDETGMQGDAAPLTAVAGYLFSKDGVKLFRRMFDENILPLLPLDANGDKTYRSAQCIPGRGPFSSMSESERERIVDLLVEAIKKSVTLGVMIAIRKEDYAEAIAASPKIGGVAGDKYSVCLIRCIEYMAAWLDKQQIPGRVNYVFEAGCASQAETDSILRNISRSEELKARYRWHAYSFMVKNANLPELFAPDLLAWEWQRAYSNATNPRFSEWRLTLKKLVDGTPHLPLFETATSVGIRAIVNSFYGLTLPRGADGEQK